MFKMSLLQFLSKKMHKINHTKSELTAKTKLAKMDIEKKFKYFNKYFNNFSLHQ